MEIVNRPHRSGFSEWAENKSRVLVLSADLTSSCEMDLFRDTYPERFFSMGMAEQNMMGFAAGLAREGFTPWVHTIAVFITRRPFDQVAMSIGYPNLPVRLVGFLPGITTPGGVTHQAIDDVALMRTIPNMTILETGDATEVESVLDVADAINGPVYIRMLRGEIPRLFPAEEKMQFGKARILDEGDDLLIITSGICTEEALRATAVLGDAGLSIGHLHLSTLKPFDDPLVADAIRTAKRGVIVMENHTIIGGVGSAVAELMAEAGSGKPLIRMGLKDRYAHGASKPYLMKKYELDAFALVKNVVRLTGKGGLITEAELEGVRLSEVHSLYKAEAL